MLLTIFIGWMVLNVGLVAFVIAHPPRHLTAEPVEEPFLEELSSEHSRAA